MKINEYNQAHNKFSWNAFSKLINDLKCSPYKIIDCKTYAQQHNNFDPYEKILVMRFDVDRSPKKMLKIAKVLHRNELHATFFYRLHSPFYHSISFENVRFLKKVANLGFEIGLHCEPMDCAFAWQEDPANAIRNDLTILSTLINHEIFGAASHGDISGLNNLDFWKEHKPQEFGLLYEAYDEVTFPIFKNGRYISDSEVINWKAYENGILIKDDTRSVSEHLLDNHPRIYLLLHPFVFRQNHFFED